MVSLRFSKPVERKLTAAARKLGRTKTAVAREAVLAHLEDLEDIADADAVMTRVARGQERVIPSSEIKRELGL